LERRGLVVRALAAGGPGGKKSTAVVAKTTVQATLEYAPRAPGRPAHARAGTFGRMPPSTPAVSEALLDALRSGGAAYEQAVEELHALLLRAARFEVSRRRGALAHVRGEEFDDLAMQAANDALVAVLAKLDQFRGESRFTTWAYKFALLEAGVRMRRRAWQEREVVLDSDSWQQLPQTGSGPDADAEQSELLDSLSDCIGEGLTDRQRQVLVTLAIDGVPIDVLAERLSTTRGALYKTLHDARRKLRACLAARGFAVGNMDRTEDS
jgi:RNA polymerase sigma-70 factor (ECF subfamily)